MNSEYAQKLLDIYIDNSSRIMNAGFGVNMAESSFFDVVRLLREESSLKICFLERVRSTFAVRDAWQLNPALYRFSRLSWLPTNSAGQSYCRWQVKGSRSSFTAMPLSQLAISHAACQMRMMTTGKIRSSMRTTRIKPLSVRCSPIVEIVTLVSRRKRR